MKNIRISSKLLISFIVLILLAMIIGGFGIFGMRSISNELAHVHQDRMEPLPLVARAEVVTQRKLIEAHMMLIAAYGNDAAYIDELSGRIEGYSAEFSEVLLEYRRGVTDPRALSAIDSSLALSNSLHSDITQVRDLALSGDMVSALRILNDSRALNEEIMQNLAFVIDVRMALTAQQVTDSFVLTNVFTIVMVAMLVVSLVATLVLRNVLTHLLADPLAQLTSFLEDAAHDGNLEFTEADNKMVAEYATHKDEVGRCVSAAAEFVNELNAEMDMLEQIADGDLTITPNILSDKDRVGKSLTKVVNSLNTMFFEINNATTQVSSGSRQIAEGAQTLAQVSTEQAATVEQLSASIAEIASKAKANAEMASKTSEISATIKQSAEKGSRQMDEMVSAVEEIAQASQSISSVIKAVDDIAFQTNILALNAAVEAARAGQHGKGFAVVADEVRTLAAKSAEAAKDTGVLISNSMAKAKQGTSIAKETAVSLSEIVSGINESSEIIGEIAQASESQTTGILQINTGIDQVSSIVQQNSATAQESAASSEELSGQSAILENLISQFKIKDGSQIGALGAHERY